MKYIIRAFISIFPKVKKNIEKVKGINRSLWNFHKAYNFWNRFAGNILSIKSNQGKNESLLSKELPLWNFYNSNTSNIGNYF